MSKIALGRLKAGWFGVSAAMFLFVAAPALAAADAVVQNAMSLEAAGKAKEAFASLAPFTAQRAGDPDFDFALGLAALDSGHIPQAILAFQRVLAVQPKNAVARAQIARAYALSGDIETARREFDTVAGDPTIPDPVRQRFNRIVGDMNKKAQGGLNVTGFVEAGAGYDSNVNAATDVSSLVIPLFAVLGPATLSSAAQQQHDAFARVEGGVSAAYGFDAQSRVFGSLLASGRAHADRSEFNQTLATATAGYSHSFASHDVVSLSLQSQQFWISGDHFREAGGAVAQYTHLLSPKQAIVGAAQYYKLRYPGDRLRDADRYAADLNYVDQNLFAGLRLGKEQTDSGLTDHLSNSFAGARLAAEHPLGGRLTAFGDVAFENRHYDAPDPLFLKKRRDDQFDIGAGVRYRLGERLTLSPEVSYTRNDSNITLNAYDRYTASLTVRSEF